MVNELDGARTLSSPVPSGDRLYLRTATHLYCIGTADKAPAPPPAPAPAAKVFVLTGRPR
jgi:hypothetical protein